MVCESFILPKEYEKWFSENKLSCNTGVLLEKYIGNNKLTETASDLTDCLKDFFVTVKGLVINIESIYKNRYLVKPLITYLLHLKRDIYLEITKLIDNSELALTYVSFETGFIELEKLIEKSILSKDEALLIQYPLNDQFTMLVDGLDMRDNDITTDYADDSPEIYFSIMENTHFNMAPTPLFSMDAPFEIEQGLINLKSWSVYELYRLFKMVEICAKIVSENSEVKTSLLGNSFDAPGIISVFKKLNDNNVEFEITKTKADYKIKQFLHRRGVNNAYEYTDTDIQNELLSMMNQIVEITKRESGTMTEPQLAMVSQSQLEHILGIAYEKIAEYYFQNLVNWN